MTVKVLCTRIQGAEGITTGMPTSVIYKSLVKYEKKMNLMGERSVLFCNFGGALF
jgi:hypothetical protein